MALVHKVLAVFLVVVGFLAWANLIATPIYHDGSPDYPVWQILNYFMAVAAVIILVKGFLMRRAHAHADGACPDTLEHLRVSIAFYGAVVLTMLFFWEWIWTLNPESETGDAASSSWGTIQFLTMLFLLGMDLDPEPGERDGRNGRLCGHLAPHLFSDSGCVAGRARAPGRTPLVEGRQRQLVLGFGTIQPKIPAPLSDKCTRRREDGFPLSRE